SAYAEQMRDRLCCAMAECSRRRRTMGAVAHVLAVDPVPARSQMGSSLGFHIILACFGIAFAAVTMTVEWIGIRRGDAAALLLARRWSKVMAVLVAVGAV